MFIPKLQISIDSLDFNKAIKIAENAFVAGADILEIPSYLIKKYGVKIIEEIKNRLPTAKIYVDSKIINNPYEELKILSEVNSDIVSVLALAHDKVLLDCIYLGKKLNLEIAIDLTGLKNPIERVIEISFMNPDYIRYNLEDAFKKYEIASIIKEIKEIVRLSSTTVSVGVVNNINDIPLYIKAGINIIIVDKIITESENIIDKIKELKELIKVSYSL